MILERKICVKKILDKLVSIILTLIGFISVVIVVWLLLQPIYVRKIFFNACMNDGNNETKCHQILDELDKLS